MLAVIYRQICSYDYFKYEIHNYEDIDIKWKKPGIFILNLLDSCYISEMFFYIYILKQLGNKKCDGLGQPVYIKHVYHVIFIVISEIVLVY